MRLLAFCLEVAGLNLYLLNELCWIRRINISFFNIKRSILQYTLFYIAKQAVLSFKTGSF